MLCKLVRKACQLARNEAHHFTPVAHLANVLNKMKQPQISTTQISEESIYISGKPEKCANN